MTNQPTGSHQPNKKGFSLALSIWLLATQKRSLLQLAKLISLKCVPFPIPSFVYLFIIVHPFHSSIHVYTVLLLPFTCNCFSPLIVLLNKIRLDYMDCLGILKVCCLYVRHFTEFCAGGEVR